MNDERRRQIIIGALAFVGGMFTQGQTSPKPKLDSCPVCPAPDVRPVMPSPVPQPQPEPNRPQPRP